jgi:hypothetical protein
MEPHHNSFEVAEIWWQLEKKIRILAYQLRIPKAKSKVFPVLKYLNTTV